MKAQTITILSILLLFSVASCEKAPKYRIGVSQCSKDDWREKVNEEIMREALFHDDVEVEIRSANDDNAQQIKDLEYFAANGFDLIIAAPNEAAPLTPVIEKIYDSGIPVITFDRNINSDKYTTYQGADNKSIGKAAASYTQALYPSARVIELEGNMNTSPARERHQGFKDFADSSPNIEVLVSREAGWTQARGKEVTDSLLRLYPDVNVVYAHNDRMAVGAAEALKEAGRSDVKIIGIDASPEIGIKAVKEGVIDATFIYPTEGRRLLKTALAILNGEKVEKNVIIPTRTPVNLSNAEIMLQQDEALKVETNNIKELKGELELFSKQYNAQKILLYAVILIVVLLAVMVYLLLRNSMEQKRHREMTERQSRQLEEATQSKLAFFTNVSHDLRTPLTLISEPINQLLASASLTKEEKTMMKLASKNSKILHRLINQILDFRKYESGKLHVSLREENLAVLVEEWGGNFRAAAKKNKLKYEIKVFGDKDSYNMALDAEKMERVFFNLLSNAFKFTKAGGSITVILNNTGEEAILQVKDTGKGIKEEDAEKVFDRFFKSDELNPEGSGIGLALCKAFVELHGGSISVRSQENKGSEFSVTLPVRHAEPSAAKEIRKASECSAAGEELANVTGEELIPDEESDTILIIDDNEDICTLLQTLLQDKFRILTANDGWQGIKLATKYVPDLVICDIMMPGIDGLETCRRLKEEVTTSHIPVLMLTACALDTQRIEGYAQGADSYMAKPFNSEVLKANIESLLKNRKMLQQLYGTSRETPGQGNGDKTLPKRGELDNSFYKEFMMILEEKMGDSALSVDAIAEEMGISRVQLYRKIKSLTNYAPTDLLRQLRLEKAAAMIKTTDTTISEIGFAVGFSSHSYFTRCYKDYFGELPSETQRRTSKVPT